MAAVSQDVIATTLERYSATMVKNLPKQSPGLAWIAKNNRSTEGGFSGRVFRQPLEYGLNSNVQFYSGAERFRVDKTAAFTYADFYLRQIVGTVVIEGIEESMNDGKEAQVNYLTAKVKNLEKSLQLIIAQSFHFDGTEFDGKAFSGVKGFVPDNPALGTVGGIDPASVDQQGRLWWQSQIYKISSLPTPGAGQPTNVRNMTRSYNRLNLLCSNGPDKPDMMLSGGGHYTDYLEEVQEKQMITDTTKAGAGFTNLMYMPLNLPIIYDPIAPDRKSFMLNTEYIYQRKAKGRWMTNLKSTRPVNQDVSAETTIAYGNLTIANRARQGVLIDA